MSKEDIKITIENQQELLQFFETLDFKNNRKLGRAAIRKGARVIIKKAKTNFKATKKGYSRDDYRSLLKGFKIRNFKDKIGVVIGNDYMIEKIRNGKKWYLPYPYMVEEGTPPRYHKTRSKKYVGRIMGTDFFKSAIREKGREAVEVQNRELFVQIEKMIKKLNAKN